MSVIRVKLCSIFVAILQSLCSSWYSKMDWPDLSDGFFQLAFKPEATVQPVLSCSLLASFLLCLSQTRVLGISFLHYQWWDFSVNWQKDDFSLLYNNLREGGLTFCMPCFVALSVDNLWLPCFGIFVIISEPNGNAHASMSLLQLGYDIGTEVCSCCFSLYNDTKTEVVVWVLWVCKQVIAFPSLCNQ